MSAASRPARRARRRRHRMAIDQQAAAERRLGLLDQPAQRGVIRPVEVSIAPLGLGKAQFAGVDLLAAGHHPGDRAEPHAHPRRARVDVIRQRVREHRRVEFLGLAVDVEIGARERRREQRRAERRARRRKSRRQSCLRSGAGSADRAARRRRNRRDSRSRYAARRAPAAATALRLPQIERAPPVVAAIPEIHVPSLVQAPGSVIMPRRHRASRAALAFRGRRHVNDRLPLCRLISQVSSIRLYGAHSPRRRRRSAARLSRPRACGAPGMRSMRSATARRRSALADSRLRPAARRCRDAGDRRHRAGPRGVASSSPGIRVMFITGFAAVALQDDGIAPNRPRVLGKAVSPAPSDRGGRAPADASSGRAIRDRSGRHAVEGYPMQFSLLALAASLCSPAPPRRPNRRGARSPTPGRARPRPGRPTGGGLSDPDRARRRPARLGVDPGGAARPICTR